MRRGLLALALVTSGCVADEPYRCDRDEQCQRGSEQGVCEPTGFCSFDDGSCSDSGRRYGDLAGLDLGGACVPCVAELAGGAHHMCARLQDGALECWGANTDGQLGDGSGSEQTLPVRIEETDEGTPLGPVASVAAGSEHTCAALVSGDLLCWGDGDYGRLGLADLAPRVRPAQVPVEEPVAQVAAGLTHTCIVDPDGAMSCFGDNRTSALGVDQDEVTSSVEPIDALDRVAREAVGAGAFHSCALTDQGAVLCWGGNNFGQVGNGSLENATAPATALPPGSARAVATADHGSCAVLADGTVVCWGDNALGQLGNGSRDTRDEPVEVVGLTGATQVVLGGDHACARLDDGSVWCWGSNALGQLGPDAREVETEPVRVVVEGGVLIAAAESTTCVLDASGAIHCWGEGRAGERGDGRETDSADGEVGLSCR